MVIQSDNEYNDGYVVVDVVVVVVGGANDEDGKEKRIKLIKIKEKYVVK